METLTIRGHHLFDMLGALATGESSHKTLGPVALKVRAHPKTPIRVVVGVDDICAPCEWWDHDEDRCARSLTEYPDDNQNSLTSDENAIRVLGLNPGDVMKWEVVCACSILVCTSCSSWRNSAITSACRRG